MISKRLDTRSRLLQVAAILLALFLITASCGGSDDDAGFPNSDQESTDDSSSGGDQEVGAASSGSGSSGETSSGESAPVEEITLEVRPGVFQLTVDQLPAGVEADKIRVSVEGSNEVVTADVVDDTSAVVRGLSAGPATVTLLDEDDVPTYQAQPITIPGEESPADDFYLAAKLDAGFGYIETRDGTTLSANVILPGDPAAGPYPTLVEYSGYEPSNPAAQDPYRLLLPNLGYALVQVNVRGTGCSGGSYDAFERIQSLDGYDVIETVAAQDWSANVGMFGVSYPGIMQLHVASTQPPSLAAIGPLSVTDRIDSVLYPGGIYNNGFGETWSEEVGERAQAGGQPWTSSVIDQGDSTCENNQALRGHNPDLVELAQQRPFLDAYSLGKSAETHAEDINVPVFLAGAWQDEQTGGRFPALLDELENAPVLRAVMFNGLHIDSASGELLVQLLEFYNAFVGDLPPEIDPLTALFVGAALGELYGEPLILPASEYRGFTAEQTREAFASEPSIRVQFEQGATQPNLPISSFLVEFETWPHPDIAPTTFFVGPTSGDESFGLSADPSLTDETATFTTQPEEGQLATTSGLTELWTSTPNWNWPAPGPGAAVTAISEPMTEDMVLIGPLSADLWVSASDQDAEIEVTVAEVAPDGSETYIQSGWLQLSRRALSDDATELSPTISGLEQDVEPLTPDGEPVLARVEVLPFAHVFRTGSQLKVTIDTPGASRPRWKFAVSESETDVTIHSGPEYPSAIVAPVIPNIEVPTERPPCGSLRGQPCRP